LSEAGTTTNPQEECMAQKSDSAFDMLAHAPRVAANGLLDRRVFLRRGAVAGLALAGGWAAGVGAASIGEHAHPWQKIIGAPLSPGGEPSTFVQPQLKRGVLQPYGPIAPGTGVSLTPLHALHGTITPSALHFERHHNGVPQIDPAKHTLTLHGLVERPLVFDMNALMRYPMVNRICFIECSGNSFFNTMPEAKPLPCGMIHGLVSCTEWTGISLSLLLQEAGIDRKAKWVLAEGTDSAAMSRSIPLDKALDDVLVALWQNGEPVRPEQGFPMRLVIPGFEGNMSVKWLHRLKLTEGPTQTKDETSKYTDRLRDGTAEQFTFVMGVKSVITRPSGGMTLSSPGFHEISGIAWSGAGKIRRVEVSADGGKTWGDAFLHGPVLDKSLTRFSMAWQWDGGPVQLQSRATDDLGRAQISRDRWIAKYAPGQRYHYNAIQTWAINDKGETSNVYL
jgi:sulfane dehydrogenase subunit SoxC